MGIRLGYEELGEIRNLLLHPQRIAFRLQGAIYANRSLFLHVDEEHMTAWGLQLLDARNRVMRVCRHG